MELADDDPEALEPPEGEAEPWWHPAWIPWGDYAGDVLVIDCREGPGYGRLGMAWHDATAEFTYGRPSLTAYLEEVADALEGRTPYCGLRTPRPPADGILTWHRTPPLPRCPRSGVAAGDGGEPGMPHRSHPVQPAAAHRRPVLRPA
jgi:hypothetical protein